MLSNINRLEIIKMLRKTKSLPVFKIAEILKISEAATSKHLILLKNLDVLDSTGKDNNVYYSINPLMPTDFKSVIELIK